MTRFSQLLFGMSLFIVLIAMIEFAALWWIGAQYEPKSALRHSKVADFSVSRHGRWGASRIRLFRAAIKRPVEYALLIHDMQHSDCTARLDMGRHDPFSIAISPTGDQVAFTTWDGMVCLSSRHRTDDPPRVVGRFPHDLISHLTWSPDGQRLAAWGGDCIYVWAMPAGELLHKVSHDCKFYLTLSFSTDSQTLRALGDDAQLRFWDVSNGKLVKTFPVPAKVTSSAVSADGRVAAFAGDAGLFVWDTEQSEELWRKTPSSWRKNLVALSHDNLFVATIECHAAGGEQPRDRVVIRCARTGRLVSMLDVGLTPTAGVVFARDGTICVWDERGVITRWNTETRSEAWRFSYLEWPPVKKSQPSL